MSYEVIYRLPFTDDAGNTKRIDLLQLDYAGSITEADGVGYSPVFTSLEGQNSQKQRTLWGTELVANLFSKTDFEFLDLLKTASEREFRLELYENSTLKHAGYVIPDSVSESYTQAPYGARVGAVSLGALQGIPYKDGSSFYEGREDVLTIVSQCLDKLDFGFDIWDSTNTYEDGMNSTSSDSPLTQVEIDQESFIFNDRGRTKALSCYDVLERVLKPFVVNVFQDDGAWKIIPIELRGQSRTVRIFNSSGVLQSTTTHNPEDTSYDWVGGSATLKTLPALREIDSVYEHGLIPNLVGNFDFNEEFNSVDTGGSNFINVPNQWEVGDINDFEGAIFNPAVNRVACSTDNAGPNAVFLNSDRIEDGGYIEFEDTVSIEAEENDTVLFSLFYAPESRNRIIGSSEPAPNEVVTVPIQVKLGSYYLTAQGTWTTIPTIIEIDDLGDGNSGFTTLASLPISPIASGFRRFDIASQPIESDGALRVRIYKPISENQGDSTGDSFGVVAVSEFSVEYYPEGSPQTESRTFVGERDVDSFSEEVDFHINHGDGPTNIHPSAFTISGSKTESWDRGSLTGSISEIAIRTIAGETQLPYNVITGTQRTSGTFDRYFTDQGTKYIVSYGQYDERKNYFQGDYVEQFESSTTISISEFEEQQSGSTSGVSGGGGGSANLDNRYFKQSSNLSEGTPSTMRTNLGLVIGTDVQAWSANLDTYASNALTAGELGQLQNINSVTISNTQWGYLGVLDQNLRTTDTPTFGQVSLTNQADSVSDAVRADREITIQGTGIAVDTPTQNLTGDLTFNLSFDVNDPLYINGTSLDIYDHGLDQSGVINTATQNIYGRKQFQSESQFVDDIFLDKGQTWDDMDSFLRSATFASGFAGSGIEVENVNGQWVATVDGLVVRDFARFYELIVEKVRAAGGTLIINDGMRVESVTQTAETWNWDDTEPVWDAGGTQYGWNDKFKCFIEEDLLVEFAEDDLVKSQTYTGRGVDVIRGTVTEIEGGDQDPEVNTPARYFEIYTESGSGAVEGNEDFVRFGNLTDEDRQGGIILTSSDSGAPYQRMYNGLDSWDKEGSMDIIKYQSGRLDNITDPDFPSLDGSQTNLYGVYVDGGFFNNVEVRGKITVLSGNAATDQDVSDGVQESKDYTDSQISGSTGNETIRSDAAPTQRSGGASLVEGDTWIETDAGDLPYTWNGSAWERSYTIIDAGTITLNNVNLNSLDFVPLTSAGSDEGDIIATINASSEGLDITGDRIQLTGDTSIAGSFNVTGSNITLDGDTTITGAFELNGDALINGSVEADKLSVTNLQAVSANMGNLTVDGTLSGTGWFINSTDWDHPSLDNLSWGNNSVADYTTASSEASDLTAQEWVMRTNGGGTSTTTLERIKISQIATKRSGINRLGISYLSKYEEVAKTSGSTFTYTPEVGIRVKRAVGSGEVEATAEITSTSYGLVGASFLEVDISSLSGLLIVEVFLKTEIVGDAGNLGTDQITVDSFLRGDISIRTLPDSA